jgi:hypothetical protein
LPVVWSDAELIRLAQGIRAGSTPQQVVLRAQIIRGAAPGQFEKATASALGIRRETAAMVIDECPPWPCERDDCAKAVARLA